jgi:hypothetical protein
VRLGWADHELTADGVRLWALAHGLPDRLSEGVRWTREAMLAADTDPDASGPALDQLLRAGLVRQVDPDTDDVVDFARRYRIQPLMVGLGNTAADPSRWTIGVGATPVLTVPVAVYHLWKYAHLRPTLWAGCEAVAELSAWHSSAGTSARDLLRDFTTFLHPLLACSAAFLDRAES